MRTLITWAARACELAAAYLAAAADDLAESYGIPTAADHHEAPPAPAGGEPERT